MKQEQKSLFRKEAIAHNSSKWAGKALLISGVSAWLTVSISLLFILVLVLFITFGSYTRRITIEGEVTTLPRAVNVFSTHQGYITNRFIDVGEPVKKGKHLYQLDVSKVTHSGTVSTNTRLELENQISQLDSIIENLLVNKKNSIENIRLQLEKNKSSREALKEMLKNINDGVNFMYKGMEDYHNYLKKGLINKEQLNNQVYLFYQQKNMSQNIYSQIIQEDLQIANLKSDLAIKASEFDNQISQYKLQRNDIQRQLLESDANGEIIINSPVDGRVESLSVTEGQMVNTGDSLAQLIPSGNPIYYIVMWLPNNSIPYINKGDIINISYDAFPYEKFGQFPGVIDNISYLPASTQEMSTYSNSPVQRASELTGPYYKVTIRIDRNKVNYQGKRLNISNGMKAQATFFLEKRPIYQWMFTPFYKMKKTILGPVSEKRP